MPVALPLMTYDPNDSDRATIPTAIIRLVCYYQVARGERSLIGGGLHAAHQVPASDDHLILFRQFCSPRLLLLPTVMLID
jgi:hypothetical protein